MDPFSIATAAVTLASTAFHLSKSICGLVRGVKEADHELQALGEELRAISVSLDSVGKVLKSSALHRNLLDSNVQNEADKRLLHVEAVLNSCRQSLDQLQKLVQGVTSGGTSSLPQKAAAAFKIKLKESGLKQIRQRLHSYRGVLQLELQTLDL